MELTDGQFACLGVRIDAWTLDHLVGSLEQRRQVAEDRKDSGSSVHLCNAYTLALARKDPELRGLLNQGDVNLPDGTPVAWVGRRLGFSSLQRPTRGFDVMTTAIDSGRSHGWRHYLYGSTEEVVTAAARALSDRFPGAEIVGVESPPFRDLTAAEITELASRVAASDATHMWIGLGTPRQDHFVESFKEHTTATMLAVGAAFDFAAGSKPEAPSWMHGRGVEWIYRLITEPRRLWKRYLFGNSIFILGLLNGEVEGGSRPWRLVRPGAARQTG